jgi:hypothetical protein
VLVASSEAGLNVNPVKVGGVASGFEMTVKVVGNPAAASWAVFRVNVFCAASGILIDATVHVPASLNCGIVRLRCQTPFWGVPLTRVNVPPKLFVRLMNCAPEGLLNENSV